MEAGRAGLEVVEEQSTVAQSLARLKMKLRMFEGTLRLGDIGVDVDRVAEVEKTLPQEEAVNTDHLTTEEVARIDQASVSEAFCVNTDGLLMVLDCSTSASRPSSWRRVHQ